MSGAAMADDARIDLIMLRLFILLVGLAMLAVWQSGGIASFRRVVMGLVVSGATENFIYLVLGGCIAILLQLFSEGHLTALWVRLHPQTAPTEDVRGGQRARVAGFKQATVPSTLVGTSTSYLNEDLDLKTTTLVKLCFFAFSNISPLTISNIESNLRLGTGRKQRAFLKLAAGVRGRPNLKRTVHRYWRSVNGSSRLGQNLFGELCHLAHVTGNLDAGSLTRLKQVGGALQLSPDEMSRALNRLR